MSDIRSGCEQHKPQIRLEGSSILCCVVNDHKAITEFILLSIVKKYCVLNHKNRTDFVGLEISLKPIKSTKIQNQGNNPVQNDRFDLLIVHMQCCWQNQI